MSRRSPILEVLVVYGLVTVATLGIMLLRSNRALGDLVQLGVGLVFLFTALRIARSDPRGVAHYGIAVGGFFGRIDGREGEDLESVPTVLKQSLPEFIKEVGFALAVAAVVFPPFVLLFFVWHGPAHAFVFAWPREPVAFLLTQALVIALPEEAFFRGYIQTRLGDAFANETRTLGADVNVAALGITSLLFGLIHAIVDRNPLRLVVFFPGLLFGWVRARRGGIGAATFVHALSNVLADFLVRGWLP